MSRCVRIKICGIRTAAEAAAAAELGADAVGLNFYPSSPRYVDAQSARAITQELPPFVEPVGVFVEQPAAAMQAVADVVGFRTVQTSVESGAPQLRWPYRLVAVFRVADAHDRDRLAASLAEWPVDRPRPAAVLIDAKVAGQHGGTGRRVPWSLLAEWSSPVPLVLAGGLTPENVAEAIRVVRPYAVDVASGVERSPGKKDVEKMRRFIGEVREAAARLS
ncbi:MAG: phosphoribosylanthranilate isomerase [Gemmataceae bacterium]|nr:phosphoribosylanthranilate isomerase [Gemmataceae bacterium]MDW8265091.1 phosphoribosylanthranilate isomerase [Gemmataceae bacterium]